MKTIWNSSLENLPEVGQRVWYHYTWIGTHAGEYIGELPCEFEEVSYPYFRGEGGTWKADCETFWCEWGEEQPEPPEESLEQYKWAEEENRKGLENIKKINFEDIDSIIDFLKAIKEKEISYREGAEILFDCFDAAWVDGLKAGRGEHKRDLFQLHELKQIHKYSEFIELVATPKRPDGTYNYCREALEQKAKELL